MIRDGIDPLGLDLADVLDVAYTYLVDGETGLSGAQEVRQRIDTAMQTAWVDRETWGTSADTLDAVPQAKRLDKASS